MSQMNPWVRDGLLIAAAFAIGWSARPVRTVSAASSDVQFQMHGLDASNALLMYEPEQKSIYVYRAVMTGNANLQCSYRFRLGEPGGVIRREQCATQTLIP